MTSVVVPCGMVITAATGKVPNWVITVHIETYVFLKLKNDPNYDSQFQSVLTANDCCPRQS